MECWELERLLCYSRDPQVKRKFSHWIGDWCTRRSLTKLHSKPSGRDRRQDTFAFRRFAVSPFRHVSPLCRAWRPPWGLWEAFRLPWCSYHFLSTLSCSMPHCFCLWVVDGCRAYGISEGWNGWNMMKLFNPRQNCLHWPSHCALSFWRCDLLGRPSRGWPNTSLMLAPSCFQPGPLPSWSREGWRFTVKPKNRSQIWFLHGRQFVEGFITQVLYPTGYRMIAPTHLSWVVTFLKTGAFKKDRLKQFATSRKPFRSRMISTGLKLITQLDVLLRPAFNCSTWQKMQNNEQTFSKIPAKGWLKEGAWLDTLNSKFWVQIHCKCLSKNTRSRPMREKSESPATLQPSCLLLLCTKIRSKGQDQHDVYLLLIRGQCEISAQSDSQNGSLFFRSATPSFQVCPSGGSNGKGLHHRAYCPEVCGRLMGRKVLCAPTSKVGLQDLWDDYHCEIQPKHKQKWKKLCKDMQTW